MLETIPFADQHRYPVPASLPQVEADLAAGVAGAVPVPPETSSREAVVAALEKNVLAAIAADRKITALKQLQVRGDSS